VIAAGERPLHALRERGVQYVEVRLMDLNPFLDVGIDAETMRFLDLFLLHALLSDSPPDTPEEIAALKHNQHLTAERGREPGLRLERNGAEVLLVDWAAEVMAELAPVARHLDAIKGGTRYAEALAMAQARMDDPASLPSARVLQDIAAGEGKSFVGFVRQRSAAAREALMALPYPVAEQARFAALAAESTEAQKEIEAVDEMPFEQYRAYYVSPDRLTPGSAAGA
jgi:glutamate--cysteine ligase